MIVRCYRKLLQVEAVLYEHFRNFISHILQKVHKKKKASFSKSQKKKETCSF